MLAPLSPEAEVTETVLRIFVRAVAADRISAALLDAPAVPHIESSFGAGSAAHGIAHELVAVGAVRDLELATVGERSTFAPDAGLEAFHLHIVDDDLVDATGARGGRYPKTLTKCELPSSGLMSASAGWCFSPLARIFLRSIEWIAIVWDSLCEAVDSRRPKDGP
jgi:hypothetical protein